MKMLVTAGIALTLAASACGGEASPTATPPGGAEALSVASRTEGLVQRAMPSEDPGPPFYARLGLQFYQEHGTLAVPFYRDPDCIPADFNLLEFFHFPGPDGPGAFACPLLMTGTLQTEIDAPPTVFPLHVRLQGSGTPIWFVDWEAFQREAADGVVTVGDLKALSPRIGRAASYRESLHPRAANHKVVIQARGAVDGAGGPMFTLGVTDIDFEVQTVRIRIGGGPGW